MKLSKEDILSKLKERIGDDTSDEAISLIEDISDTLNDYEERTKDSVNWEQKYKQNDEEWRKKYKERFFNSPAKEEPSQVEPDDDEKEEPLTFEKLFKE